MTEYSLRDKLITEYIGTFFLTLTICLVGVFKSGSSELAPFAIASTLMVMIYAGGHVSGAHYNPAVTISIYLRGHAKSLQSPLTSSHRLQQQYRQQ